MRVGWSAHTVFSRYRSDPDGVRGESGCHVIKRVFADVVLDLGRAEPGTGDLLHAIAFRGCTRWSLARDRLDELSFILVMSASVKPRLAGRQPSNRGGVPRVTTRFRSQHRLRGKRGSAVMGPPE